MLKINLLHKIPKKTVKEFLTTLLPAITFHIWGGVGSQLFAIAAIRYFNQLHPNRRVRLCYHSGGVTRRTPDSIKLLPFGVYYSFSDDFSNSEKVNLPKQLNGISLISRSIALRIIHVLKTTKIIVSWSSIQDSPKFWTLQVRGHYRTLPLSKSVVDDIWKIAIDSGLVSNTLHFDSNITLHYRLGDLVGLKPIVNANTLVDLIGNLLLESENSRVLLLSDSPDLVKQSFNNITSLIQIIRAETWETIDIGVHSKIFIGTNSKLSYWICLFRFATGKSTKTFLPESVRPDFEIFLSDWNIQPSIVIYYESPELDI